MVVAAGRAVGTGSRFAGSGMGAAGFSSGWATCWNAGLGAGVASSSMALWVGCGAALPGAGLALPLAARVDDVSAMGAAACEVVRRPIV